MKFKLKLYFSLAPTFIILIIFGQLNVSANGLSYSSGNKAEVDTIENFKGLKSIEYNTNYKKLFSLFKGE